MGEGRDELALGLLFDLELGEVRAQHRVALQRIPQEEFVEPLREQHVVLSPRFAASNHGLLMDFEGRAWLQALTLRRARALLPRPSGPANDTRRLRPEPHGEMTLLGQHRNHQRADRALVPRAPSSRRCTRTLGSRLEGVNEQPAHCPSGAPTLLRSVHALETGRWPLKNPPLR